MINDNPNLEFYQLVYGLIIIAMLVFGFFKGAGILITLTRGSLKVIPLQRVCPIQISGTRAGLEVHHELSDGVL